MDIKLLLRNRRKELKLTMKDVADRVGVSESTISRWESGVIANMTKDNIISLAKALKMSPSSLVDESESDDDFIAALGEIKPLGELPPEAEAINIFAESFGERIIKVDDNLFFGECGMLSEDELNYIKSSAGDAIKFAYEQIKKKRLSSLF